MLESDKTSDADNQSMNMLVGKCLSQRGWGSSEMHTDCCCLVSVTSTCDGKPYYHYYPWSSNSFWPFLILSQLALHESLTSRQLLLPILSSPILFYEDGPRVFQATRLCVRVPPSSFSIRALCLHSLSSLVHRWRDSSYSLCWATCSFGRIKGSDDPYVENQICQKFVK